MKLPKTIFIITLLLPLVFVAAYLADAIGTGGGLASNATMVYLLSLTTVVLSLFTAWMSMRLFSLSMVRYRIAKPPLRPSALVYNTICSIRLILLLTVIILDLATYYLTHATSSAYLAGIVYIAVLFCWPRQSELDSLKAS